ncbi:MAG TPA: PqiC family protein [Syntrophorhabdaceae bacterium]|jgi:uncharacterized lipoprotein YmbA|nr:PqiC family protein [Syntrophorhabdaceae bacterium]HNT68207.1 PqiC family protein [Syntrophorhabdaceae bacterium]
MRDHVLFRITILSVGIIALLVSGCGSSAPSRFYTLSSLKPAEPVQQPAGEKINTIVRIGPVDIPDYLDRPQIVTRTGQSELAIAEFDRWGGSLRNDVSRVLIENLSSIFIAGGVTVVPWKQFAPGAYRVPLTITRLDVTPGKSLYLKAQFSIIDKDGKTVTVIRETSISRPVDGTGYNVVVNAISDALAELSREVAGSVRSAIAKAR